MSVEQTSASHPVYDRHLLLSGAKRNAVLELWEVRRYGIDSYGDADYVAIYGMRPAEWYAKGVRLLGRTAVECTRDALGHAIGEGVAAIAAMAPQMAHSLVLDLFAGSGNTLHWLVRHMPGAEALGFEADTGVFRLTRQNLEALALPIRILNTDYRSGLSELSVGEDQLLIAFIAPPWGDALNTTRGLDLRSTTPPIREIMNVLFDKFPQNPILCAVQIYEAVDAASLEQVRSQFDWSAQRVYALTAPGTNHGVLFGSKRWVPAGARR